MNCKKIMAIAIVSFIVFSACKHEKSMTPPVSNGLVHKVIDGFVLVDINGTIEGSSPTYKLAGTSGDWKGVFIEGRKVKLSPYAIAKTETTYKCVLQSKSVGRTKWLCLCKQRS